MPYINPADQNTAVVNINMKQKPLKRLQLIFNFHLHFPSFHGRFHISNTGSKDQPCIFGKSLICSVSHYSESCYQYWLAFQSAFKENSRDHGYQCPCKDIAKLLLWKHSINTCTTFIAQYLNTSN